MSCSTKHGGHAAGARVDRLGRREQLERVEVANREIRHHRGRRALGQCLRGERPVVVEPTAVAEPEALVLERVVELVGEHELDQGAIGGDRVGDHEQALGPRVVGRGREVAGRLVGGSRSSPGSSRPVIRADRVVRRQPEPARARARARACRAGSGSRC